MTTDEKYMAHCLHLARLGVSFTAPNPMVGAVVVHNDRIIGEGFHRRYGKAHAEPMAISSVKEIELLPEATLYVSLEPCSHFGKTPPCANLIVSKKIKRVVIACLDPNPKVAGKGVHILREAGIDVEVGVLEQEARQLNRRFYCFQEKKRPFVLLKWAQTKDGFIDKTRKDASEKALSISNSLTRQLTHKMRIENMAIMVSTNTVLLDNPSLTARFWSGKSPIRIAIDNEGKIPEDYHLMDQKVKTIIFTSKALPSKENLEFIPINDTYKLELILQKLFERNIQSILVEGGSKLHTSFINAGLWDEANVEISTAEIYDGVPAPELKNAEPEFEKNIEGHRWIHYFNVNTLNS